MKGGSGWLRMDCCSTTLCMQYQPSPIPKVSNSLFWHVSCRCRRHLLASVRDVPGFDVPPMQTPQHQYEAIRSTAQGDIVYKEGWRSGFSPSSSNAFLVMWFWCLNRTKLVCCLNVTKLGFKTENDWGGETPLVLQAFSLFPKDLLPCAQTKRWRQISSREPQLHSNQLRIEVW